MTIGLLPLVGVIILYPAGEALIPNSVDSAACPRTVSARDGAALGDSWLGQVFEGFSKVLEEETGDAFRVRIERVEEKRR